ncbi:hypothetical protein JF540_22915 [Salipiger thiooxidans]|uniref:hypothetical protein n=1 Tax=Salipiger thiooxidans TaxID=282683 RepID=UPI001A90A5D4|nr:hypothetical protein [Salipiger thiooxidans]MBN8189541.1 hypothetical protein [Salipiger thiooxidans]
MSENWPGIAAEVRAALVDVTNLEGTITRVTAADESTYPPTPGGKKTYSFIAMQDSFALADRDGTQITARDVKVIVTRPVVASDGEEIEPKNGDSLTVAGKTYSIVGVEAEAQGGYAMLWTCQCRRGED